MFENSVAQQQSPQTSRPAQPTARRTAASSCIDSPSSGGQQRLKNAINLGKAVGAKVNDLLRRKEPNHLGDIGVTEVNTNVAAAWSCVDQLSQTAANSHSFDSFPRLDPPPPSGKKRLPRALKTTQDMMISSDPVVSSPETTDCPSFLSSPEKMPLIAKEELRNADKNKQEKKEEGAASSPDADENKVPAESETTGTNSKVDEITRGEEEEEEDDEEKRITEGGMEELHKQLQLSVPDLINKDPPSDSRAKPCDVWQKAPGPDSRLASTPCSGKTPCRISLGEEVLLGNGAPCSKGTGVSSDDAEPHPDLLSFE
ncbi:uncharacterized protein C1orf226 homolog [Xenentodon cancila]